MRQEPLSGGGGSLTSYIPPTQFSSPIHGLLTADRQCLGGGGLVSGGWDTTLTGQFIQKHRGGNSNVADVTCIHYAPSPKVLNFTARLLLRRIISLCAFSYGA